MVAVTDFYIPKWLRLQLGLSTYSFPWAIGVSGYKPSNPLSATHLLQYAHAKDIRYVQFGDNMPLHTFSQDQLKQLKEAADNFNINIEVGTRRLSIENMLLYLAIAQKFTSPFLRVVIDDAEFHPNEKEVIETIKTLLPHFQKAGVCIAIENHDRFPATTFQRIIEQTDPMLVGVCLDTANSLGANEGVSEVLQVLAPYTVNLQYKRYYY